MWQYVSQKYTGSSRQCCRSSSRISSSVKRTAPFFQNSPNPPCRCMLCRPHPLRVANPQRFSIPCIVRTGLAGCLFVYRAVQRFSAVFIPAPLSAVEVCFRTSLCGHTFSGLQSPVAVCHRAALLIGLPLCLQRSGYLSRFLRRACTCGNDPAFALSRT